MGRIAIILGFLFTSCDGDKEVEFDYHAHVMSPNADNKKVNDVMPINIEFESHSGEKVHHINVKIYSKNDATNVIYDKPTNAHVHADGSYTYTDELQLTNEKGVEGHTDWVLEAKVWGHEAGLQEVVETVEFHVHPE